MDVSKPLVAGSGIAAEEPRSISPRVRGACPQDRGRTTGFCQTSPDGHLAPFFGADRSSCSSDVARALIVNIASAPVLYLRRFSEGGLRAQENMLANRPASTCRAPRSTESRPQGSTRAARQPSVRPQTPWSRTELDRKHNHLDPTEPK